VYPFSLKKRFTTEDREITEKSTEKEELRGLALAVYVS